ncbi:hypothetical protein [Streptomyces sp. NPDC000878]
MDALKRAFLKLDHRFGGSVPPPRAQVFVARHPVGTGIVVGVVNGLLFAWALSGFSDTERMFQAVLVGLGFGVFLWLLLRVERWRQTEYLRAGGFPPAGTAPPVSDALPVWFEGLLWICAWAAGTVLLWLANRHSEPPRSWLWSAVFAGVAVIAGWAARLAKQRGRD